jgi:hypothetical protein
MREWQGQGGVMEGVRPLRGKPSMIVATMNTQCRHWTIAPQCASWTGHTAAPGSSPRPPELLPLVFPRQLPVELLQQLLHAACLGDAQRVRVHQLRLVVVERHPDGLELLQLGQRQVQHLHIGWG